MGNVFNSDFQEFLLAFNKAKVKYVLVGGYSVIYYGYPRTTGDLDLFVETSEENYQRIVEAFSIFKMPIFDMTREQFLKNKDVNVFTFGRPPVAIEILKEITGFAFDEVYSAANEVSFEEIPLRVIHINQLKKNKSLSGRPKDLDDLSNLESKS